MQNVKIVLLKELYTSVMIKKTKCQTNGKHTMKKMKIKK